VSDDELFFEEISEQIEKRIMRQKVGKLNKNDLIKSNYNTYKSFIVHIKNQYKKFI